MLVSTNWRWLTFDCIGAGALRVHKQMRTKAIAQPVLLAGLHLLVSAKRVMLGKRLLRTEAHARCVMLANSQRRSKQLAKTACLEERQMWATASSVMET